jgi:hypothetical protein
MGATSQLGTIELGDNSSDYLRKMRECDHDGPANVGISFREKYLRNVIYFGVRKTFGNETKYGFTISCLDKVCGESDISRFEAVPSNFKPCGLVLDAQKARMLSPDIELVECSEYVIPSGVRLQIFEDLSYCHRGALYQFQPLKIPKKPRLLASGDREVDIIGIRYAVALRDGHRQDVEGGAHGIDVCARFGNEDERQRIFFDCQYDVISRLKICIFEDYADIILNPAHESFFEGWEIGYGPL